MERKYADAGRYATRRTPRWLDKGEAEARCVEPPPRSPAGEAGGARVLPRQTSPSNGFHGTTSPRKYAALPRAPDREPPRRPAPQRALDPHAPAVTLDDLVHDR